MYFTIIVLFRILRKILSIAKNEIFMRTVKFKWKIVLFLLYIEVPAHLLAADVAKVLVCKIQEVKDSDHENYQTCVSSNNTWCKDAIYDLDWLKAHDQGMRYRFEQDLSRNNVRSYSIEDIDRSTGEYREIVTMEGHTWLDRKGMCHWGSIERKF